MGTIATRSILVMFSAIALLACAATLPAQEAKKAEEKKEPPERIQVIPFVQKDEFLDAAAWVACMGSFAPGNGAGWGVIGARMLASEESIPLAKWQFVFDEVLPLGHTYLDPIRDGRVLPDLRAKLFQELPAPDRGFYLAYLQALRLSDRATMEMFDKSAREYDKVVYTHLISDPRLYRGKIITARGKISSIRWSKGPPSLEEAGIVNVYTTWITSTKKGVPPFTAVFTELPKELQGLDAAELEKLNLEVTFKGYFLGHIRFPADKDRGATKKDLVSPYLVGKTLIVNPPEKAEIVPAVPGDKTSYAYVYIIGTVGSMALVAFLVAALNIWFRRGDHRVQTQLAEMRERQRPFAVEPADPDPVPESTPNKPDTAVEATPEKDAGFKTAEQPDESPPPAAQDPLGK